jgi:hypothetical protein|tara:strand:- start:814 stop:1083 length:270 start_codon:yes stop_codon:yes gene_type:complete
MKTNKNAPFYLLKRFSEEEQQEIRDMYVIYGDESKILVDKHKRPCVRYYSKDEDYMPHRIKAAISGYSYFPIRKERVYGSHKAYDRDTK